MEFCYNVTILLCKKTPIFRRKQSNFVHRAHSIAVVLYTDLQPPTFFPQPEVIDKRTELYKLDCLDSQELTLDMKFTKTKRQNFTEIKLLSLIDFVLVVVR
jgi:hypothetical protein